MSFEENKAAFFWTCDRCGLVAEFPPFDFYRALSELKARGWSISREPDGWLHWCAKCERKAVANLMDRPVVRRA